MLPFDAAGFSIQQRWRRHREKRTGKLRNKLQMEGAAQRSFLPYVGATNPGTKRTAAGFPSCSFVHVFSWPRLSANGCSFQVENMIFERLLVPCSCQARKSQEISIWCNSCAKYPAWVLFNRMTGEGQCGVYDQCEHFVQAAYTEKMRSALRDAGW